MILGLSMGAWVLLIAAVGLGLSLELRFYFSQKGKPRR